MGTVNLGGIDREGWIQPGEPCIVFSDAGSYSKMANVRHGEIDKVGARDVRVMLDGGPGRPAQGERFNGAKHSYVDDDGFRHLKRYGSGVGSQTYYLVHPDSMMGRQAANYEEIRRAHSSASSALNSLGPNPRTATVEGSMAGVEAAEKLRVAGCRALAAYARLHQLAEAKAAYHATRPRPERLELPESLDLFMGPEAER